MGWAAEAHRGCLGQIQRPDLPNRHAFYDSQDRTPDIPLDTHGAGYRVGMVSRCVHRRGPRAELLGAPLWYAWHMIGQQTFSGNPLDRAATYRDDTAWLDAAFTRSRNVLVVDTKVLVTEGTLASVSADTPHHLRIFLGMERETPVFAVAGSTQHDDLVDVRAAASRLSAHEAAIAATAKALVSWHASHRYCSRCATETRVVCGGWRRQCPSCNMEHFPRTDPVVIMLVHHEDQCLLGRQAAWPKGRWSTLAGFVEPGETPEEACAREVFEETRINVRNVGYRGSQPWPFPYSLMIGMSAEAVNHDIVVDTNELEDAAWFDRARVKAMLAGADPEHNTAPSSAIAHHLIKEWANT